MHSNAPLGANGATASCNSQADAGKTFTLTAIAQTDLPAGARVVDLLALNSNTGAWAISPGLLANNTTYNLVGHVARSDSGDGNASLSITAQGLSPDPLDATSAVLDNISLSACGQQFSIPLGLWPLRQNFVLSAQSGDSEAKIDVLQLVPTGPRPVLGVNATDLAWDANASSEIDGMVRAGVKEVRMNMRGNDLQNTLVALIQQANAGGISVEIIIAADPTDFATTSPSPLDPNVFLATCGYVETDIQPVSKIDVGLFTKRVSTYLQTFADKKLKIAGIEVGNEWDWACFNTDMPIDGAPSATTLTAFINKYAALLQATRVAVDQAYTDPNSRPPLGTFGMSNVHATLTTNPTPINILQGLTSVNGTDVLTSVDFIGEHLYGALDVDAAVLQQSWQLTGKPAWVTEWAPLSAEAGWARYTAMENFLGMLADQAAYKPQVAMAYDWDGIFFNSQTDTPVLPEATLLQAYP